MLISIFFFDNDIESFSFPLDGLNTFCWKKTNDTDSPDHNFPNLGNCYNIYMLKENGSIKDLFPLLI